MDTTTAQRQVRVLLLYAVAGLVFMAIPSAWYWARISYTDPPTAIMAQHDRLRNSVELLRSENAHFGLVLNQAAADPKTPRTVEGIDASISHELHEMKELAAVPAPIGPAVHELADFFETKLHPRLLSLRSPEVDDTAKAEARVSWNDFDILIGRLEKASQVTVAKRLGGITTASTATLAVTLWLAVLAIPALIVQGSQLRKRLSTPADAASNNGATANQPDFAALESARNRAAELEHALEGLAGENARLNAALEAKGTKKPENTAASGNPPTQRSQGFAGTVEALLNVLNNRARVTLSRDGRFSLVAQLGPEEGTSIGPILSRVNPPSAASESAPEPPAATGKATLLLVDDDRLNRTIFKQVLGPEVVATIVEAASVDEAWAKLEGGVLPDLIVSDIVMPERDGFDFVSKLRADNRFKHIEVIMCTAHGDKENIARAAELGVHNYLLKPFAKEDVQRLVLSAIDSGIARPSAFLEAQKRLGLDEESYAQLAEMLSREVADTITFVRTAMSRGYRRAAVTRMNSLRGSSQTVGDDGLADAIMRVEKELEDGELYFVAAELERLEEENSRLAKSIIHLRHNPIPPVATGGVNVILPSRSSA